MADKLFKPCYVDEGTSLDLVEQKLISTTKTFTFFSFDRNFRKANCTSNEC